MEPERKALAAAREIFHVRLAAVDAEIKAIEEQVGELQEDFWHAEGKQAFCAMTGLPILESDQVGISIQGRQLRSLQ